MPHDPKKRSAPDRRKVGEPAANRQKARERGARIVRNDQVRLEMLIEEFTGMAMQELDMARQNKAIRRRELEANSKKKKKNKGTKFKKEIGS